MDHEDPRIRLRKELGSSSAEQLQGLFLPEVPLIKDATNLSTNKREPASIALTSGFPPFASAEYCE